MAQPVFITDDDWSALDGETCRVKSFTAKATVKNGRVTGALRSPEYASFTFESPELPEDGMGVVTHKMDFLHLWSALEERRDDEEVIFFWLKSRIRRSARLFRASMPRLLVWVCPRDAYELMTDENFKPELTGTARFDGWSPRAQWKPPVME